MQKKGTPPPDGSGVLTKENHVGIVASGAAEPYASALLRLLRSGWCRHNHAWPRHAGGSRGGATLRYARRGAHARLCSTGRCGLWWFGTLLRLWHHTRLRRITGARLRNVTTVEWRRRSIGLVVFHRLTVGADQPTDAGTLRKYRRRCSRGRSASCCGKSWRCGWTIAGRGRQDDDAIEHGGARGWRRAASGHVARDGAKHGVERLFFGDVLNGEGERRRRHPFGIHHLDTPGATPGVENLGGCGVDRDERETPVAERELDGFGAQQRRGDRDDRQHGADERTSGLLHARLIPHSLILLSSVL